MENILDSQPPPTKLRLQLSGEPWERQLSFTGVYSLQSSLVNGFPYWKHDSSERAIWMFDVNWKIGDEEDIGTIISSFSGPFCIEEWPNNIFSKWEFFNGQKFQEAKIGDIVFEDCSPKGNLFYLLVKFKQFFDIIFRDNIKIPKHFFFWSAIS